MESVWTDRSADMMDQNSDNAFPSPGGKYYLVPGTVPGTSTVGQKSKAPFPLFSQSSRLSFSLFPIWNVVSNLRFPENPGGWRYIH